jgi:hypothetical protein
VTAREYSDNTASAEYPTSIRRPRQGATCCMQRVTVMIGAGPTERVELSCSTEPAGGDQCGRTARRWGERAENSEEQEEKKESFFSFVTDRQRSFIMVCILPSSPGEHSMACSLPLSRPLSARHGLCREGTVHTVQQRRTIRN